MTLPGAMLRLVVRPLLRRCLPAALVCLLLPQPGWTAPPPAWLTLPAGATYDLVATRDGKLDTRIPVGASAAPCTLHARIFDVVFKEGRSEGLAAQFAVQLVPGTASAAPALQVRVAHPDEVAPGTYAVSVQVGPKRDGDQAQVLTLTLTRRAAQLGAAPAIVMGQQHGWDGIVNYAAPLRLAELSDKAAVTQLAFREERNELARAGVRTDAGTLAFGAAPRNIAAGGVAVVSVAPSGEFPLGTTKGTIQVVSPASAAPVAVAYEVRTWRPAWLIVLCAGAGAALGWYFRVVVAARVLFLEAKRAASETVQQATTAQAATDDAAFRAAIEAPLATLQTAVEGSKAAAIDAANDALRAALAAAVLALQERLLAATGAVNAAGAVIDRPWTLPDAAREALAAQRALLETSRQRLRRRDASRATALRDELAQGGYAALYAALGVDGAALADFMTALPAAAPPLPNAIEEQIVALATWARGQLQFPATHNVDLATLGVALQQTEQVFLRLRQQVTAPLHGLTTTYIAEAARALGSGDDPALAALRDQAQAHAAAIAAGVGQPALALSTMQSSAQGMHQAWENYLAGRNAARATLAPLLTEGKWDAAIALAVAAKNRAGTTLGPTPPAQQGAWHALTSPLPPHLPPFLAGQAPGADAAPAPVPVLLGTLAERRQLMAQSKRLAALQTVFMFMLFVIGAFLLYADSWVGTAQEMLGVFVLAFGVDLSSTSIFGAFKKLKLPEPA